eukprot:COSAG04_NODE_2482_length_4041_cov_4.531710_6_plen_286_part_00
MPRTLSGLVTGEFDDIEVQGSFKVTSHHPAEFQHLVIGDEAEESGLLVVNGNIDCSSIVTTGLEADLTFTFDNMADIVYNGGTPRTIDIPSVPTLQPLTFTSDDWSDVEYDPASPTARTINIPSASSPDSLTLNGTAYNGSSAVTVQTGVLSVAVGPGGTSTQTYSVPASPALVSSGFGPSFTLAQESDVLIELQVWVDAGAQYEETLMLTLVDDRTDASSDAYLPKRKVYTGLTDSILSVRWLLSDLDAGTHEVGLLAEKANNFTMSLLWAGTYPDLIMSATIV